jgi:hypothetical protein
MNQQDRRRFYRIRDRVALRYRPLTDAEVQQVAAEIATPRLSGRELTGAFSLANTHMDRQLDKIRDESPEVASYLEALNKKLDLMARTVLAGDAELAGLPAREADLSAAGIAFRCQEPLPPGRLVEVRILTYPSLIHILALGRVVRSEQADDGDTEQPVWMAVDFEHIRPEDQDLLAQHVRRKENELLQTRRLREA